MIIILAMLILIIVTKAVGVTDAMIFKNPESGSPPKFNGI